MKANEYKTRDAGSASALTEWTFNSSSSCESVVLPDGCRDIIFEENPGRSSSWFISDLSSSAYQVPTTTGTQMRGIRLKPGVEILLPELTSWLQSRHCETLFGTDQLDEFCTQPENLCEALQCLATGERTIQCAARELGVSLRSLQRLIKEGTGQTPYFWLSLARVRKAGRSLFCNMSLSDVAFNGGFSDQAHMNREMKKWFQRTPNQIKSDKEMLTLLSETGYG